MKQLLPSKMVETEDSVRYSTSEVGRLAARGAVPRLHAEPAGRQRSEMLFKGMLTVLAKAKQLQNQSVIIGS